MKKIFDSLGGKLRLSPSEMLMGLAAIVLGLILLIAPGTATAFVFNGIGAICIAIGLFNVVRYFMLDTKASIISNALATGLVWIIIGVAVILLKGTLISILPVFFGVIVLIGGIAKLQGALSFKRMNATKWYIELCLAVLSIVFGSLILLNPFSTAMILMRIIGAALLIEGIADMISISKLQKMKNDYFIEVEMKDTD